VRILGTPNSVMQMTGLSQGKFDIAMTAVDNIVAYVEGQGEAPIGPQPEFFAFMGSDSGFLSLIGSAQIERIEDFAGKTLSVDALTTGYAFVLYELLRRHGLERSAYGLRRVGRPRGLRPLVNATSVLGRYQGNVAAARRSWAKENAESVVAFIRGYKQSIGWLYEPAHRSEALDILVRNVAGMTHDLAEASYAEMLDPQDGFFNDCHIDIRGLDCVLELRSRYAEPKRELRDRLKYCDLTYYQRALA
jgi:ABC-type nitrate/sulfonate/bicarbonate transport system substrate-binding protein